ncbi:molybdate ABC transporter substrate-binding protein [Heyndrickxia sporothermodurans]|uniref:molybdate ABC transporter substrate-binding protein n=1 Tax=Heyndrickxia sporothermodurans TaxID=46224 RepID=UPI002DBC17C2|nr:molybdate ABC transporter substrate-binding protein [Heyndrickxia sporothermodurans]MEB6551434.1 molybdate ABC transporter substrate-binding protein [Heyndrickxia sporothermodurans]
MKRSFCLVIVAILLLIVVSGCSKSKEDKESNSKVELTMSAAASLQDALNEIRNDFVKEHPQIKVNFNFGSSGALQQQILQGAPADLFFSAAEDKFTKLIQKRFIDKEKGTDLVRNELVLVVSKNSKTDIHSFEDIPKVEKVAIGTPESVPAGQYAKETLEHLHLWGEIKEKTVYAKDVRQVLTYVETGNVDAGIVYKTDALGSQKVKIIATAAKNLHAPIIYPVGMIKNGSHPKETQLFYDYLQSESGIKVLEKYGFKGLK